MKYALDKKNIILVCIIITIATIIRFYNINGMLFDFNPLRQALNAFVARNYAFNPASHFLLPQADNMGPAPGYLMFELPILPYFGSLLIKLYGLHNWVFRFPSVIFFILSAVYFYKLCVKFLDFKTSMLALIFYCLTPISIIMSRVFQVESFMMFALFFSIYYFISWLEKEKIRDLCISTLSFTVLVLLKITNLYIFLFVGLLFFIYKKPQLIKQFIIPGTIVLAVNIWWWLIYPAKIRMFFPTSYTLTPDNIPVFSLKHIIDMVKTESLSLGYWLETLKHCIWIVFSPLVAVLFLLGIFFKKEKKLAAIILAWFIAVLAFLFIVPDAATQDYYKLHLVPIGVICAAIAYQGIFSFLKNKIIVFAFWSIIIFNIFLITYPIIRYKPIFESQIIPAKIVENISKKEDLIVASFGPDPMLLFYCNRKGWSLWAGEGKDGGISSLELKINQGARYFVCGNLDEFERNPDFKNYLFKKYKLIAKKDKECSIPRKFSVDYLVWSIIKKSNYPPLINIKNKLECSSLGYIIFDLTRAL